MTAPRRHFSGGHLIIMAKAPRLGRVKSRLAADIGAVAAAGFYRRTLAAVGRRLAADARWRTWLGVTPDRDIADDRLWPGGAGRIAQGGGDLGRRMSRLLGAVAPGPVVLVGADIPGVRAEHVWQAFRMLGRFDAVFGPATDGGFWLVGLKHPGKLAGMAAGIFEGIEWSRPDTLEKTLAGLPKDWRVGFAATLDDVDDGDALRAYDGDALRAYDGAALRAYDGAAFSTLGSGRKTR